MKKMLKRSLCMALGFSFLGTIAACGESTPSETNPREIQWVTYNANQDEAFLPKDIFAEDLFVSGLVPGEGKAFVVTENEAAGAFVLKGEYGKCYEIKIPEGCEKIIAFRTVADPIAAEVGSSRGYTDDTKLYESVSGEAAAFMYTCRKPEEYLVVYTGKKEPIYIGERTILAEKDTEDHWYVPEAVGSIAGDCTLGDYCWDSETMINKLYEPVRAKYPAYISREVRTNPVNIICMAMSMHLKITKQRCSSPAVCTLMRKRAIMLWRK